MEINDEFLIDLDIESDSVNMNLTVNANLNMNPPVHGVNKLSKLWGFVTKRDCMRADLRVACIILSEPGVLNVGGFSIFQREHKPLEKRQ